MDKNKLVLADSSWAGRLADFDRRIFGKDAWPHSVWSHELTMKDRSYLVVPEDVQPLRSLPGVCAVGGMRFAQDSELLTLAVAPPMRRNGFARTLLSALIDQAQKSGAQQIFLEVRAHASWVQAFYKSFGFVSLNVRRGYYSDDDALVMKLSFHDLEKRGDAPLYADM